MLQKERKSCIVVWEDETIGVSRQISWSIVGIILFCSCPVVSLNTISPPLQLHNSEVNLFNREQPPNRLSVSRLTAHQSQFPVRIKSDSQLPFTKTLWPLLLSNILVLKCYFWSVSFPPSQLSFETKCKTEKFVVMYITSGPTLKTFVSKYGGCKKHISELN